MPEARSVRMKPDISHLKFSLLVYAKKEMRRGPVCIPHSSTLDWKIAWTEEPGRLQSMGSLESDTTEQLHFHFSLSCIGERNGNPLQCSCLENPRDGRAWWAAVYGVAQSRTQLKRLSSSSSSSLYSKYILAYRISTHLIFTKFKEKLAK